MTLSAQKTIVITGASDGIGAAAARRLHGLGHRVIVVGRSPEKTEAVADELDADRFVADFADLGAVRNLAASLAAGYERIDVLANNAGGVFGDPARTVDGYEQTLQINHLAPFLLTTLLVDTLVGSNATVIQTSSITARMARRPGLDGQGLERELGPIRTYAISKLLNILFTLELDRRYGADGVSAAAFHPGAVASNFGAQSTSWLLRGLSHSMLTRPRLMSPSQGASQLVWLADSQPGVDWQPGRYYESHRPARWESGAMRDGELARELWERSAALVAAEGAAPRSTGA